MLSSSKACVLKLKATSKNPPTAPETMACKHTLLRNLLLEIENLSKTHSVTFKRGIVTVGGAAFA